MTASTIPGYPYGPVFLNGQRVVENPADYAGRHRVHVATDEFTGTTEVTLAPLGAGERWLADTDYTPRHYAKEVAG